MKSTFFIVKDQKGGYFKIEVQKISFVKSLGNYVQIYTSTRCYTILGSLKSLYNIFKDVSNFARVHRSYLVNLDFVEHFSSEGLILGDVTIPVTPRYFSNLKSSFIATHLLAV